MTITVEFYHYAMYRVFIDDVWVGFGYQDECEALAEELRSDTEKAHFIKEISHE